MSAGRRCRFRTLVMVFVSRGVIGGCDRCGVLILTMPRACNLASPQQLWDQEKCCDKAGGATIGHDGV